MLRLIVLGTALWLSLPKQQSNTIKSLREETGYKWRPKWFVWFILDKTKKLGKNNLASHFIYWKKQRQADFAPDRKEKF